MVRVQTDLLQFLEAHVFVVPGPEPVACSLSYFLRLIGAHPAPVDVVYAIRTVLLEDVKERLLSLPQD